MASILIVLLEILVVVAVLWLILYLFSKYVTPIDSRIIGVIIFIAAALLIIYLVSNKGVFPIKFTAAHIKIVYILKWVSF